MKRGLVYGIILMILVLALGTAGEAQDTQPPYRYGLRAGFGLDPDQFVIGLQAELNRVISVVRFAPSLDAGFGDNFSTYLFNADLRLDLIPLPKSRTVIYVDAGPTLAVVDPDGADSDLEIGLSLAAGLDLPMGRSGSYNLEARLGIGDIPEFRLLLGVLFGGGHTPEPVIDSNR